MFRHLLHVYRLGCQFFPHEFWHGLEKRFLMDFGRFGGAFGRLFGALFRLRCENKKTCLDCTGVSGLHIPLSGKCSFPSLFLSFFSEPCAGGPFDSIFVFLGLPWDTPGRHFGGRGRLLGRPKKRSKKSARPGEFFRAPGDRKADCAGPAGEYERASLSGSAGNLPLVEWSHTPCAHSAALRWAGGFRAPRAVRRASVQSSCSF